MGKVATKDLLSDMYEEFKDEMPKKLFVEVVKYAYSEIGERLKAGNDVQIAGLGVFKVKFKPESKGHNPKTGESIIVLAHKVVKFKPSVDLKNALK